jgi:hypothetical protein
VFIENMRPVRINRVINFMVSSFGYASIYKAMVFLQPAGTGRDLEQCRL